ncbi:sodium- and chloride-dependent glycine transporter 2-like [Gigantopelta aegis]|uniref:sodium- and chloride-dependent glycine transporter 2-like n=1 Tax=Gigantopelta aegis TaxID=1735272 RepID=UPI001B88B56D|nr:sodium- and chloride-dependent glycine transporter 2-like [Gigantopelta aegis]
MSTNISVVNISSSWVTLNESSSMVKTSTAAEEFWSYNVLNISNGIEHPGDIQLHLLVSQIVAWLAVFLCVVKGIRSVGKVVYVSATVPYVLLLALLIRGLMLPGAVEGIKAFIIPRWENLLTLQAGAESTVWIDSATQAMISCGIGTANIITIARYNRFHNNCYRDAILVSALDCFTSVFAGFVVFAVIGYMADYLGTPVDQVVSQGPGIAFIVYPEALSTMAFGQIWAAVFFLMLFLAGIDSQFVMVEVVVDFLCDTLPKNISKRRWVVTSCSCLFLCMLGLPFITQNREARMRL